MITILGIDKDKLEKVKMKIVKANFDYAKKQELKKSLNGALRSVRTKEPELRAFFSFLLTSFFSLPMKEKKEVRKVSPRWESGIKKESL